MRLTGTFLGTVTIDLAEEEASGMPCAIARNNPLRSAISGSDMTGGRSPQWTCRTPRMTAPDHTRFRWEARAGISGPHILVGHSYGALLVRLYADRYGRTCPGRFWWTRRMRVRGFMSGENGYGSVKRPKALQRERVARAHAMQSAPFDMSSSTPMAMARLLSCVEGGRDLPPRSNVLHASPSHVHLLWRVTGFDRDLVEGLQKQVARELGSDSTASPITQDTRSPGLTYLNSPVVAS